MSQLGTIEAGGFVAPLDQLWEGILRMLVGVRRDRKQRLDLSKGFDPRAHRRPMGFAPPLGGERRMKRIEKRKLKEREDDVTAGLNKADHGAESRDRR